MPELHVRKVSEEVVARLKQQARRSGRSMEAEHRLILEEALFPERRPGRRLLEVLQAGPFAEPDFKPSEPVTKAVASSFERLPSGYIIPVRARQPGLDSSWDGIASHHEEKFVAHLKSRGIPLPTRNANGGYPLTPK